MIFNSNFYNCFIYKKEFIANTKQVFFFYFFILIIVITVPIIGTANKIGFHPTYVLFTENYDFVLKSVLRRIATWYHSINIYLDIVYYEIIPNFLDLIKDIFKTSVNRFAIIFGYDRDIPEINTAARFNYLNLFWDTSNPKTGATSGIVATSLLFFPFGLFFFSFILGKFYKYVYNLIPKKTSYFTDFFILLVIITPLVSSPLDLIIILSPETFFFFFLVCLNIITYKTIVLMKKILIIYNYFSTNKGSFSNRYYELSKIWIRKGYNIEFITSPYFKSDIVCKKIFEIQYIDKIKLNVINFPDGGNKSLIRRLINSIFFTLIASALSLFKRYDLLICSSGPFTIGIPNLINIFFRKKGLKVFETRDIWPQSGIEYGLITNKILVKLSYIFEKLQYKYSDFIVTLSQGQENYIKKKYPDYAFKIHTISQICNVELFKIKLLSSEIKKYKHKYGKILTYIGGLGKIHNISYWIYLISRLNKINQSKFSLLIIGSGPDKIFLENLSKNLN